MQIRGHAIECRIYAEDPENSYFPSPGTIATLAEPAGPGIRLDSGIYEGWTVPIDYDPLLAKLVGYGADRVLATKRLQRALDEYFVGGIKTNTDLFKRILSDADFEEARLDTGYLDRLLKASPVPRAAADNSEEIAGIAAGIFAILDADSAMIEDNAGKSAGSSWSKAGRMEALHS